MSQHDDDLKAYRFVTLLVALLAATSAVSSAVVPAFL
jgi:hypothetical protein